MDDQRFAKQQHVLARWLPTLAALPAVDVVWLEGSLVDGRGDPGSDIDIRLGVADTAFAALWDTDRMPLLTGLGEHLLLHNEDYVRALTADGVLVELLAYRTSTLNDLALHEWEFRFNRLPNGPPTFQQLPAQTAAEAWPGAPPTEHDVRWRSYVALHLMATAAPSAFHQQEWLSGGYLLDFLRNQLIQTMYQRIGLRFSKRVKHLNSILPADFQTDLARTYTQAGEAGLAPDALAAAILRTLQALRTHLQALHDQVGGGFDAVWFDRMYTYTERDFAQWMSPTVSAQEHDRNLRNV